MAEADKEADIQQKFARLAEAEEKLSNYDNLVAQNEKANQILHELHAAGAVEVDEHGNVSPSKQKPQAEFQDFERQ